MTKHNDDYIPTYADIEHERDARRKRLEGKSDPRQTYICKFTIDGKPYEERVTALCLKDAEDKLKQQWGMVGVIPRELMTSVAEEEK